MSLCNCIGQSEVKLDHLKFIYESCIKATNKLKSYSFTVIVSGRAGGFLIGGAEMVRVGRRGGGAGRRGLDATAVFKGERERERLLQG